MDRFFDCMNVRSFSESHQKRKDDLKPYTSPEDSRLKVIHSTHKKTAHWTMYAYTCIYMNAYATVFSGWSVIFSTILRPGKER